MKIIVTFLILFATVNASFSQKLYQKRIPNKGNIELAPGVNIPMEDKGYTLWLPKDSKAKGLVVFFHAEWDSIPENDLIQLCVRNGLAIVYLSTGNRFELLHEQARLRELNDHLHEIISKHKIDQNKILFAGMSLEGTRALRMVMYSKTSKGAISPAAIVICDSPIDMTRFHAACKRAEKLNAHPAAANEGYWVSNYLESRLAGNPQQDPQAYISYSPYSHHVDSGGNAKLFLDIPIKAYHEPDIKWWMENRSKDYNDMNSIDLAAFINQLKISGHKNAELISTENKGYLPDGTRHPHSWSIVDEEEMIKWFLRIIEK